jgi:hypothetical protein
MRHFKQTKIFVSAHRATNTAKQNAIADAELACDLALIDGVEVFRDIVGGYTYRDAHGEQRHTTEAAYVCFLRPGSILEAIDEVTELARQYRQDTVLVVHGDDAAEIVECNTDCSAIIGTFQRIAGEPEIGEDYSKIDGVFYVVR